MSSRFLIAVALLLSVGTRESAGAFDARAFLQVSGDATTLETGDTATLVVELDTDLLLGGEARKPLLQLAVPDGVELFGGYKPRDERTSPADWLDFYTDRPFGRLVETPRVEIPLRISGPIASGASIGINLVTYLDGETTQDARLVRLRLEQPITAGASARKVEPSRSDWGRPGLTHIGDRAANFDLSAGDGERLELSELLTKKQPVFLLTYRSDW